MELVPGELAPCGHLDHLNSGTTVGVEVVERAFAAFLNHVQAFRLRTVLVVGLHLQQLLIGGGDDDIHDGERHDAHHSLHPRVVLHATRQIDARTADAYAGDAVGIDVGECLGEGDGRAPVASLHLGVFVGAGMALAGAYKRVVEHHCGIAAVGQQLGIEALREFLHAGHRAADDNKGKFLVGPALAGTIDNSCKPELAVLILKHDRLAVYALDGSLCNLLCSHDSFLFV